MAIYDHYDQEMFQFHIKNGEEHPDQWTLKYMQVSSLLKSLLGTYEIDPHVPGLLHSVDRSHFPGSDFHLNETNSSGGG